MLRSKTIDQSGKGKVVGYPAAERPLGWGRRLRRHDNADRHHVKKRRLALIRMRLCFALSQGYGQSCRIAHRLPYRGRLNLLQPMGMGTEHCHQRTCIKPLTIVSIYIGPRLAHPGRPVT